MSRIRGKNSKPEVLVRSVLHGMGYRFRLHRKDLPGSPDVTLPKYKVAIFVNGCFWHLHENCKDARLPKSNQDFWRKKLEGNRSRDQKKLAQLVELGWSPIVVWECELKESSQIEVLLKERLKRINDNHG